MKIDFKTFIVPNFWKKFWITFLAIVFMGTFLSLLVVADWGADPFSFMNLNISSTLGILFGNWQLMLNVFLLIFVALTHWELLGFGTLLNMVLIGYVANIGHWILQRIGFEAVVLGDIRLRGLVFIIGIVCFVISAAVYMNSQMGLSPFDALCKILSAKCPKIPFAIFRIGYDLSAVCIGLVASYFNKNGMKGSVIGGLSMAILLGPTITFVGRFMSRKIFKNKPCT